MFAVGLRVIGGQSRFLIRSAGHTCVACQVNTQNSRSFHSTPISKVRTSPVHQNTNHGTFDESEVRKFESLPWWDESGEMYVLHTLNALRVPMVRDALAQHTDGEGPYLPLKGRKILDVGCGGGLLSEPLARLGADVLGIDAGEENVIAAELHASEDQSLEGRLKYKCGLVEDMPESELNTFDGVVASEIIEHVSNPSVFVHSCCQLVKPGGSIFFTTINKTALAYALAVFAAENILGLVPKGAHDWNKFIPPEDLQYMLTHNNFDTELVHGMLLNPCTKQWRWISDTSINYAIHAVKQS